LRTSTELFRGWSIVVEHFPVLSFTFVCQRYLF
jgi:hypothetical protein